MRAGQVLVSTQGKSHLGLILPALESGLFDDNWRIRQASVQVGGWVARGGRVWDVKGSAVCYLPCRPPPSPPPARPQPPQLIYHRNNPPTLNHPPSTTLNQPTALPQPPSLSAAGRPPVPHRRVETWGGRRVQRGRR